MGERVRRPMVLGCALVVSASLAASAAAVDGTPRVLNPVQRSCLVFVLGKVGADRYAQGGTAPAAKRRAVAACMAPPAPPRAERLPCTQLADPEFALHRLPASGTLRATALFVDFSDLPGAGLPPAADGWMADGVDWLSRTSYGRLRVVLHAHAAWVRMPRTAASYRFDEGSPDELSFIEDAIEAADTAVSFSRTDLVYTVPPRAFRLTHAYAVPEGLSLAVDGGRLRFAAVFGGGDLQEAEVLAHETLHLFGLPDLYSTKDLTDRFVGVWDVMGAAETDLFAWHRVKLGYLREDQFVCARPGTSIVARLAPVEVAGGRKAVIAKLSPASAVIVENRQRLGNDDRICESGALVYTIDVTTSSGYGRARVHGGDAAGQGCGTGARSDAPLRPGESVTVSGVKVTVLSAADGFITVRVTR